MSNSINHFSLVILNQSPDGVAIMTKESWEAHKQWVLSTFKDEVSEVEAQELHDEYIKDFEIVPATKQKLNFLINICKLKVNETKEITSFVGDFRRF